jgi:hypothetical protein
MFDPNRIPAGLRERGLLPDTVHAMLLSGSLVRDWQHANSDVDVYVIVSGPWRSPTSGDSPVSLRPETVPTETVHVDDCRWEVKYWQDSQVDQVVEKVSREGFESGAGIRTLTDNESTFLERLRWARPVSGAAWLDARRRQLAESAFQTVLVTRALLRAEGCLSDAAGQLESTDPDGAVISARLAFGHVVDALLGSHGELCMENKWRTRRMRAVAPAALPYDRYWRLETMRDFDPSNPREWIEEIAKLYRTVSLAIDV